jgi:Zn-dependent protease with chaperone function
MAESALTQPTRRSAETLGPPAPQTAARPAAVTAARVSRASLALGVFGIAASLFVVSRLVVSWRVTPSRSSHHVSVFGQPIAYPSANLAALVVLVLAALGLIVTLLAVAAAAREAVAARRFARRLARLDPRPRNGALVVDGAHPQAFCAGLLRPRVYISTGALEILDSRALDAVLEHERHHARRRDPLRLAAGRVLARALFFLPWLDELARHQEMLAELGADENAIVAHPSNRAALARAMMSFSESADGAAVGVDPARVDHLLGERPPWRVPAALCAAAALTIGLLTAVAVLLGALARGSASLSPPVLSRQPCVVVLALIPAAIASLAAAGWRRRSAGPVQR